MYFLMQILMLCMPSNEAKSERFEFYVDIFSPGLYNQSLQSGNQMKIPKKGSAVKVQHFM